jgi:hypothetical protein
MITVSGLNGSEMHGEMNRVRKDGAVVCLKVLISEHSWRYLVSLVRFEPASSRKLSAEPRFRVN